MNLHKSYSIYTASKQSVYEGTYQECLKELDNLQELDQINHTKLHEDSYVDVTERESEIIELGDEHIPYSYED